MSGAPATTATSAGMARHVEPPPTSAESRAEHHAALARVASAQCQCTSKFANGVSIHVMSRSTSFASLRALLNAAQTQGHQRRIFVGSRDGSIVVSVNFNYEPPPATTEPVFSAAGLRVRVGKKRVRDPMEEAVNEAVLRVKRNLKSAEEGSDVSEDMLETARGALYTLLTRLRGAGGEDTVESWGLSFKKPEAGHALNGKSLQRPRLILSARLSPGVAVSLPMLFSCLGIRCTLDGMLTTQENSSFATGFDLPLSEQAHAAELLGSQRAITLFATVGKS